MDSEMKSFIELLLSNKEIVCSWGVSGIVVEASSIRFVVNGFKYQGEVTICNCGKALYKVCIGNRILRVYGARPALELLDSEIECTDSYRHDLKMWLDCH